jgi:hypothetical protein
MAVSSVRKRGLDRVAVDIVAVGHRHGRVAAGQGLTRRSASRSFAEHEHASASVVSRVGRGVGARVAFAVAARRCRIGRLRCVSQVWHCEVAIIQPSPNIDLPGFFMHQASASPHHHRSRRYRLALRAGHPRCRAGALRLACRAGAAAHRVHDADSLRAHRLALMRERPEIAHDVTAVRPVGAAGAAGRVRLRPAALADEAMALFQQRRNRVEPYADVRPALRGCASAIGWWR